MTTGSDSNGGRGTDDSSTGVITSTEALRLSLSSLTFIEASLVVVASDGRSEWQANQDGLIHLVCLCDLQEQLLRGLLEVGPFEDDNPVSASPRLQSGWVQTVITDL